MDDSTPTYMTTKEVASRLQLPINAIRLAIRDGRLRASLPSGRRHGHRISEDQLSEWLTSAEPSRPEPS